MTKAEKKLYAEFKRLDDIARRGFITLSECNNEMMKTIDEFMCKENYDDFQTLFDHMKAYHKMYLILSKLSAC